MSKHRASNHRSVSRLTPLGAGVTVALLAAGTGSAFAATPTAVAPVPTKECTDATAVVGGLQTKVTEATAKRDVARKTLRDARTVVATAQDRHDSALRKYKAAESRLASLKKQEEAKKTVLDKATASFTTNPSRSTKRALDRATREFNEAKGETNAAATNLGAKKKDLDAAPGVTSAQRGAVTTAIKGLNDAEKELSGLKADRRTARDARDAACSDVTTLG